MTKSLNNNLKKAKAGKNDEFYTELTVRRQTKVNFSLVGVSC
jgi:hypothetical protein